MGGLIVRPSKSYRLTPKGSLVSSSSPIIFQGRCLLNFGWDICKYIYTVYIIVMTNLEGITSPTICPIRMKTTCFPIKARDCSIKADCVYTTRYLRSSAVDNKQTSVNGLCSERWHAETWVTLAAGFSNMTLGDHPI